MDKNFIGQDGFVWWMGIVENRIDPLNLGRCQVRIFGRHAPDDTLIPSADLPWAIPMLPVNSPQNTTVKDGDMVVGFFTDGESAQQPIIMGVIPGIPTAETNAQSAFADRRQGNTLTTAPRRVKSRKYNTDGRGIEIINDVPARYPNSLNEPTTSRLARRESLQKTIINDRVNNLDKNVQLAGGKGSWNEPSPAYNALFPYNKVVETESGHTFEVDDTPGAERINTTHRSGTFFEIYPSGTKVEKITKSHYQIIMADDNIHVMGRCNITVDSDATVLVKGNAYLDVAQNLQARISKNFNLSVGEAFNIFAKRINIQTQKEIQANIGAQGVLNFGQTLDIAAKGNVNFSSGKRFKLMAGSSLEAYSPRIDLNPSSLLEVGFSLLTAAYTLGAFPQVTQAVNNAVSTTVSGATNTFNSAMTSTFGTAATGASPLTSVAASSGGLSFGGAATTTVTSAASAGSTLGLTSVAPSVGGLTIAPATVTAVSTGSGFGVTSFAATAGGLTIAPATSAVAASISSSVPTIGGLVLSGASTGAASLSISGLAQGVLGKVVGGSVAGQLLNPQNLLKAVGVNGTLNNLAGSVITKQFLTSAAQRVAGQLGLPPVLTNAITNLPALLGSGTGSSVLSGQDIGGFMASGASIGNPNSTLSLGSILSNEKVFAFAKDAAKFAVASAFPKLVNSPIVGKLANKLFDNISLKSFNLTPTIGDFFRPAGGGGLPSISGTAPIDDADLPPLTGEVPVSQNIVSSTIGKFFKSSDVRLDTVEPDFGGLVLSGAGTSGSGTGFQLDPKLGAAIDEYFGKISLEKIVKDGISQVLPRDINDLVNQATKNPSVLISSLVKSTTSKVIGDLRAQTNGAFSAVLGEAQKLLNVPRNDVTVAVTKYATNVFNNSAIAKQFGLNVYQASPEYNNAIVPPEAPGIASGTLEYMEQVEYTIGIASQRVTENFNQMVKTLELAQSVPGVDVREEVDAIVNYHAKQNDILIASAEEAIRVATDQMNNTVVFVVDPNV